MSPHAFLFACVWDGPTASPSVQQNSLRGPRLKPSSLGGSSTHATLDRTGSPVRLESELSSPQEVAEDSNKVKSKGRELDVNNTGRSGGQDEGIDQRRKGSVEIEKEGDVATGKGKEGWCGGDEEEKFNGGEEAERNRDSFKIEGEGFGEDENGETSVNKGSGRGRSREERNEQTVSEEEMVETGEGTECSNSNEGAKSCSFWKGELNQCDEGGRARCLKSEGGEREGNGLEINEESAAPEAQTTQEGESFFESGSARVHPAEVEEKSDLKTVEQKSESLTGSLVAEVRFSLCVLTPPPPSS